MLRRSLHPTPGLLGVLAIVLALSGCGQAAPAAQPSDALAAKQPFLVAFSTLGYCETAVCSPNIFVIKQLKDKLKDQVNFIHVEVDPYPFGESSQAQKRVPAMSEWKLRTEPWTFLVDGDGVIQAKYEGGLTFAALEPALAQLAAGEPVQLVTAP